MNTDKFNGTKLVRVTNNTHGELDTLRGKGDSFNTVVVMLLKSYKEAKLRIDEK